MAVDCIQVPKSEMVCPPKNKRKLRWASDRPISRQPCRAEGRPGGPPGAAASSVFGWLMPVRPALSLPSCARGTTYTSQLNLTRPPIARRSRAGISSREKQRRRSELAGTPSEFVDCWSITSNPSRAAWAAVTSRRLCSFRRPWRRLCRRRPGSFAFSFWRPRTWLCTCRSRRRR